MHKVISLTTMNSGELGKLLHHAENNHSKAHYTGGRLITRCRPFLTFPDHEVIAIEFDICNVTNRFDADPNADQLSLSMYQYVMDWLDESNADMLDS